MAFSSWKSENMGGDTLWIIDNSLSMGVEDMGNASDGILHSRIDRARALVLDGMTKIPGNHGVLVYARSAWVLLPISPVTEWEKKSIANISLVDDYGGSDVGGAFSLLFSLYAERTTPLHVILVSDGGDTSTSPLPPLPPHTDLTIIGMGTAMGWPIPLWYDALGRRRYKIYDGKEVTVPYDEKNIEKLARFYSANTYTFSKAESQNQIFSKLIPERTNTDEKSARILTFIGALSLLLSVLIHPYVYVKSHP